jgi:hypothetical protein
MNTTATPSRRRATWNGAPLLDPYTFRAWLLGLMRSRQLSHMDIGRACGIDERAVRRWLDPATLSVSELVVEKVGIALDGNPRLAADLYPELG